MLDGSGPIPRAAMVYVRASHWPDLQGRGGRVIPLSDFVGGVVRPPRASPAILSKEYFGAGEAV